jgi:hypothetical protein
LVSTILLCRARDNISSIIIYSGWFHDLSTSALQCYCAYRRDYCSRVSTRLHYQVNTTHGTTIRRANAQSWPLLTCLSILPSLAQLSHFVLQPPLFVSIPIASTQKLFTQPTHAKLSLFASIATLAISFAFSQINSCLQR